MLKKIYFNLLILCVVLSQGCATSEETVGREKSSDLQIRKKRVINEDPEANKSVTIRKFPFLANIKKNRVTICGGSIVSPHVVLTVATCLRTNDLSEYQVVTGSEKKSGNGGIFHRVIWKLNHPRYRPNQFEHALTLITIEPAVSRSYTEIIELQAGPTIPGTRVTIAGWGCDHIAENNRRHYPDVLKVMTVTVISNEQCEYAYRNHTGIPSQIGENEICTHDIFGQKRCSDGDTGAPLVVFRRLAGLFIWSGDELDRPDVFVGVEHSVTHLWVSSNIENIESHLQRYRLQNNPANPHHLPYHPRLPINLPANHHH